MGYWRTWRGQADQQLMFARAGSLQQGRDESKQELKHMNGRKLPSSCRHLLTQPTSTSAAMRAGSKLCAPALEWQASDLPLPSVGCQ